MHQNFALYSTYSLPHKMRVKIRISFGQYAVSFLVEIKLKSYISENFKIQPHSRYSLVQKQELRFITHLHLYKQSLFSHTII